MVKLVATICPCVKAKTTVETGRETSFLTELAIIGVPLLYWGTQVPHHLLGVHLVSTRILRGTDGVERYPDHQGSLGVSHFSPCPVTKPWVCP